MFKRSRLALLSFAVAAMSVASDCYATCRTVAHTAVAAFKTVVFGPALHVSAVEVASEPNTKPVQALRRASNFVLRLLKRERPVVTPEWRMVPST